jgi:hypothetical protein
MSSRRPRRESDDQAIEAGPPRVPPELVHGIYANNIQSIGTTNEVIIDFSHLVPSQFRVEESGRAANLRVDHSVVARIIVPTPVFEAWIGQLIRRREEAAAEGGPEAPDAEEQAG